VQDGDRVAAMSRAAAAAGNRNADADLAALVLEVGTGGRQRRAGGRRHNAGG